MANHAEIGQLCGSIVVSLALVVAACFCAYSGDTLIGVMLAGIMPRVIAALSRSSDVGS